MSQTNFFMDAKDDAEFCDMLLGRDDTSFVIGRFHATDVPGIKKDLPQFGDKLEIHLVNLVIEPKPICIAKTEDGAWLFDVFRDVHIEFQRSYFKDSALVSGRIYAKIGWYADQQTNQAFQRWYSGIDRWLKKRFTKMDSIFWIGPSARQWSEAGGLLCFGPPGALTRTLADR